MGALSLVIVLVVAAGAMTALQAPTNAALSRALGSPIHAALVSFLVGTAVLAVLAFLNPARGEGSPLRALPWWAWLGGAYGAFFVAVAAFAVPRIGVATLLTVVIAGQLTMALTLDHFGALGVPRNTISAQRLLGLLLVVAGAALARRS